MKLAVVTSYPPRISGIGEYGAHVAHALASNSGVEQLIVISDAPRQSTPLFEVNDRDCRSIIVRRVWAPDRPDLGLHILNEILRIRPDAVWFNVGLSMFGSTALALAGFAIPAICRRLGFRTVVTLHEWPSPVLDTIGAPTTPVGRRGLDLALRLLVEADSICLTTQRNREALLRRWPAANAVYLPIPGYHQPLLHPEGDPATLLMLTSHAPHKGLAALLEAFRGVRRERASAQLVVAGVDHPRFPGYLARTQRRHCAEPGIDWAGALSVDQICARLKEATIVVVPYDVATGSSSVVHQAIAFGRPVILSDVPDFRAMASEEDLWLRFVPPGNPTALQAAILELLSDPVLCRAMGRHNLISAQRNSLAVVSARYLRLLGNGARAPSPETRSPSHSGALSR